jgi:hypothetical protein
MVLVININDNAKIFYLVIWNCEIKFELYFQPSQPCHLKSCCCIHAQIRSAFFYKPQKISTPYKKKKLMTTSLSNCPLTSPHEIEHEKEACMEIGKSNPKVLVCCIGWRRAPPLRQCWPNLWDSNLSAAGEGVPRITICISTNPDLAHQKMA